MCDEEAQECSTSFCEDLLEIIKREPKKKIVIVTTNAISPLIAALKSSQTSNIFQNDKTEFTDLTPDSQAKIINETQINFQGSNVLLKSIIDETEFSRFIDSQTLQNIVNGDEIVLGSPLDTFTEFEEQCYIQRKIRLIYVNDSIFKDKELQKNTLFVIEGSNSRKFLQMKGVDENQIIDADTFITDPVDDKKNFIVLQQDDTEIQFSKIVEKYPNQCIHWLKQESNSLFWFHSHIPSSSSELFKKFGKYVSRDKKYIEESFFMKYIEKNRFVIIADIAGMGKSTILTSFAHALKTDEQLQIRINLNQYTAVLSDIKSKKNSEFPQNLELNFDNFNGDFGKLILESLLSVTKENKEMAFEYRILEYLFEKRGILYILDGFDEISAKDGYDETVLQLLDMLMKNEKNRIWITTRTMFKEKLEQKFHTFAYDMKPFDRDDQENCLKQYWIATYKRQKGIEIPNQDRLSYYAHELVCAASQTIGDIIAIPLQTKMLGEVFQEDHVNDDDYGTWTSCFKYVECDSKWINVRRKLDNVFSLYESFIKEKIVKYFLHEKAKFDLTNSYARKTADSMFDDEYARHKIFGYLAMIDSSEDEAMLTDTENQMKNEWLKDFKDGFKNFGIIDSFNSEGYPLFNHLTFAEFLAACFLFEKLCSSPFQAKQVFQIADKIFNKDVPVFAECFLYKLKEQLNKELQAGLNGLTMIQFVVRHELLNCFYHFFHNNDFNDDYLNEPRQNIIHFAADCEQLNVVLYIIYYTVNLISEVRIIPDSHHLYYLSKFICSSNEEFVTKNNTRLHRFLKDIKIKAESQIRPSLEGYSRNYASMKMRQIYPKYLRRQLMNNEKSHLPHQLMEISKLLSHESITMIIKFYELNLNGYFDHFWSSRLDINDDEKLEILKMLINNTVSEYLKYPAKIDEMITSIFLCLVHNGCYNILKLMFTYPKININQETVIRGLFRACSIGFLEVIKTLLPKIENKNVNEWTCKDFEFCEIFQTRFEIIEYVLDRINVPADERDKDNMTLLYAAVRSRCSIKAIRYLVENKQADPFKQILNGTSPWSLAVEEKQNEVVQYFESKNSIFDADDHIPEKNTQVMTWHEVARSRNIAATKKFTKIEGINDPDSDGNTPLHVAVQHNFKDVVLQLLWRGAQYNVKNNNGETPNALAKENDKIKRILDIINKVFDYVTYRGKRTYNYSPLDELNNEYYIYYVKDNLGRTVLHYAVMYRIPSAIVEFKKLSSIVEEDIYGNSPLYYAVELNYIEAVKFMIGGKCINFKFPDIDNECTDLLFQIEKCLKLAYNEHFEQLKDELRNFEDNRTFNIGISVSSQCYRSVMDYATSNNDLLIYLMKCGLNFNVESDFENFWHTHYDNTSNYRFRTFCFNLMIFAQNLYDRNTDHESLLQYYDSNLLKMIGNLFFIKNKREIQKILTNVRFSFGGEPIIFTNNFKLQGVTLLHLAAVTDASSIAEKLIENGADPNITDFEDNNVYKVAEKHNSAKVLDVLNRFKKAKKDLTSMSFGSKLH